MGDSERPSEDNSAEVLDDESKLTPAPEEDPAQLVQDGRYWARCSFCLQWAPLRNDQYSRPCPQLLWPDDRRCTGEVVSVQRCRCLDSPFELYEHNVAIATH
jgi:hypothetical protein